MSDHAVRHRRIEHGLVPSRWRRRLPTLLAPTDTWTLARRFSAGPGVYNPVRAICHVMDVSDIKHPREVAQYEAPEDGSHNFWAANDMLYEGYYSGVARVLDISGELRGDLYRQGRENRTLLDGRRQRLPPEPAVHLGRTALFRSV